MRHDTFVAHLLLVQPVHSVHWILARRAQRCSMKCRGRLWHPANPIVLGESASPHSEALKTSAVRVVQQ